MDILSHDVVKKIYPEPVVKQCLPAGWGPITYRQNTELSIAAWHWNPNRTRSDPANKRGYFTGSAELKDPIRHSYGYPLPHRGHTRNGVAERGHSRLTDGNPDTYWRSNPYLAGKFTGKPDSAHPQWVVIDLGANEPVRISGSSGPIPTPAITRCGTGRAGCRMPKTRWSIPLPASGRPFPTGASLTPKAPLRLSSSR